MAANPAHYYGVSKAWFAKRNRLWGLKIDAFAEDYNAVLPHFWSPAEDALAQDWGDLRLWIHPPYEVEGVIGECIRRLLDWQPERAVMLCPWSDLEPHHYALATANHIRVELAKLDPLVAPDAPDLDAQRITPLMLVHCG